MSFLVVLKRYRYNNFLWKKKEKKTLYENVIHQIKTLTDMEMVETGIAEADMTNLAFTNRIRTFSLNSKYKIVFNKM